MENLNAAGNWENYVIMCSDLSYKILLILFTEVLFLESSHWYIKTKLKKNRFMNQSILYYSLRAMFFLNKIF